MAEAASAHQAATATGEDSSQQRAGRRRRISTDLQRVQQGATGAAAAAPAAQDSLSRLQHLADASPRVAQLRRLQELADSHSAPVSQLAGTPEEEDLIQGKFATAELQPQLQQAPRANIAGLSYQLKSGIESLSCLSLDYLPRHHNSSQPARLTALAYAQGSDIHLAPRQVNHQPHAACHMAKKAETGDPKPIASTTQTGLRWLVAERGPVNSKQGLPHGYSISTNALHNRQHPAQLMSLFHGTTLKSARAIKEKGVNTQLGKGEFGQGFYTVYSEVQAKHIILYYYQKELAKRNQQPDGNVAVVKFEINDNEWELLLRNGVHYRDKQEEEEEEEEKEEIDEDDVDNKLPSTKETIEYAEREDQKKENRGQVLMVGKIKDKQTPYIQAVFGENSESILNDKKLTTTTITWEGNANNKIILREIKNEIKNDRIADEASELHKTIKNSYEHPESVKPEEAMQIALKKRPKLADETKTLLQQKLESKESDPSALLYDWYLYIARKSKS
jgi:hypothetical protein